MKEIALGTVRLTLRTWSSRRPTTGERLFSVDLRRYVRVKFKRSQRIGWRYDRTIIIPGVFENRQSALAAGRSKRDEIGMARALQALEYSAALQRGEA